MSTGKTWRSIHFILLLTIVPILVCAQDIANSQDHPLISRYPGQTLTHFDVKEFDTYNLVLSVNKTGAPEKVKKLEGKVTRIYYRNPKGRSTTEIIRNFEVKPESRAAIAEIAKLLKSRTNLKLFVVGHTDGTGGWESNLRLSRDRAAAVTQSLIADHGIAAARLTAHGVGPLSPVASNATEEGRGKNRRVDLVAQ